MDSIKKNAKYLKTNLLKFGLLVMIITFSSCDADDIITPEDTLTLTINVETAQDQMGDFACNAMSLHNSKVWSIGGENSYSTPDFSNSVWRSQNGVAWESVTNVGEARCGHTLTTFNGKLWLIGGENNDGDWLGDIWYSTDGSTWTNIFLSAPFGEVAYHDTVVFNDKIYVIAGDVATSNTKVWSSLDGENWTQETANAFPGRVTHKVVVFNSAIYVIGGEDIAGNKLNEIWTSTNGSTWTQVATNSPIFSARNHHTATVYNNKVWVIGGRTTTGFGNDIWYSNNMTDWTKYTGLLIEDDLHQHTALLYNDAIWLFGGYNDSGITGQIVSIKED